VAEFLRIQVTGNAELQAFLQQAVRRIERPAELMEALAARLEANIQERFDRKVDPTGQSWAALAPQTVKRYEAEDQGRRQGTLLQRTGQMRASLTSAAGDDFAEVGMSRLSDGGEWSIPLLHETGTRRMPRRGIFLADPDAGTLGQQDEAMLTEEIQAYLDDVFGAA
jgi:phage virion morphogenesis protein